MTEKDRSSSKTVTHSLSCVRVLCEKYLFLTSAIRPFLGSLSGTYFIPTTRQWLVPFTEGRSGKEKTPE